MRVRTSVHVFAIMAGLLLMTCCTKLTLAQNTQKEIRDLLGSPVVPEDAALFAATFASLRDLCGKPLEFAGIYEGITRLEFGSLSSQDQNSYKTIMVSQYDANADMWKALASKESELGFCRGLESSVTARSASFIEAHPNLFLVKQ